MYVLNNDNRIIGAESRSHPVCSKIFDGLTPPITNSDPNMDRIDVVDPGSIRSL
jgi:hypothetical protein